MAETADMASDIDLEKAQEARRSAERLLEAAGPADTTDLAAARAALQHALQATHHGLDLGEFRHGGSARYTCDT